MTTQTSSIGVCSVGCEKVPDPCPDTVGNASCGHFQSDGDRRRVPEVTELFLPAEWFHFSAADKARAFSPITEDVQRPLTAKAGSRCIQLGAAESVCSRHATRLRR